MAGNRKGSDSYFGEMRSGYSNPNFFNGIAVEQIKRNVKRIIKDIKYDNIELMDYIYFTNPKVINCCIEEAAYQMSISHTLRNALFVYLNNYLIPHNIGAHQNLNIMDEIKSASDLEPIQGTKYYHWQYIYQMMITIRDYNVTDVNEIKRILSPIKSFRPDIINVL